MMRLFFCKMIFVVIVFLMLLAVTGCGNDELALNDEIAPDVEAVPNVDADSYVGTEEVDWDFFNEKATVFVTATADGDYDVAAAMFDETMTRAFGAEGLQDAWELIIGIAGEFVGIHEILNDAVDEFFIAGVIMRHETIGFGWNIVFSEDGLIAGVHTTGTIALPDEAASSPAASNPVQREGFTDYPIVIGEGTDFPLDGILSMPDNRVESVPAAVIVHGSGPSDMDGNLFGNTPYRDIAEFLASQGVAVIRHDKRTFAHGAEIVQLGGSATVWEESIEDAILAAEILRADPRIDENRIFIIGHSLGGALAPRIHAAGGNFDGLILMAATPRGLPELFLEQTNASVVSGYAEGLIDVDEKAFMLAELDILAELFSSIADMTAEEARETPIPSLGWAYYFKDMMQHPFADYVDNVTVPVLVLQGSNDFQVLADVDFVLLQELFAGRDNVTFKLYEGLNHLFMPSTAISFVQHASEIVESPGNVDVRVLRDIVTWILTQT
jgi:alpha-beta hydrolase superfamily lysophospholipase